MGFLLSLFLYVCYIENTSLSLDNYEIMDNGLRLKRTTQKVSRKKMRNIFFCRTCFFNRLFLFCSEEEMIFILTLCSFIEFIRLGIFSCIFCRTKKYGIKFRSNIAGSCIYIIQK